MSFSAIGLFFVMSLLAGICIAAIKPKTMADDDGHGHGHGH